jgi:hypothetical protein
MQKLAIWMLGLALVGCGVGTDEETGATPSAAQRESPKDPETDRRVNEYLDQRDKFVADAGVGTSISKETAAPAGCPWGCFEANVACWGFVLWNTCWCPSGLMICPTGGRWVGGACIGFWEIGCHY